MSASSTISLIDVDTPVISIITDKDIKEKGINKDTLKAGINSDALALVDNTSREGATILMSMREYVDVLIPRGGKAPL